MMKDARSFFTFARLPIVTAALAAAIFIGDTVTRVDIAVAVLYVVVVLLAARFCSPPRVMLVAAGCVALTILSYLITRPAGPAFEGIINTLIGIGAIALITPLVLRNQSQVEERARLQMEQRLLERARIARELHDTRLQSFQGLILKFQRARNLLPTRPDQAMESLDTALDAAERAIMEGRDAIYEIRGSLAEDRDVAAEISALGEELASANGRSDSPAFRVVVEGSPKAIRPIVREEVVRIASEALRNAHAHAHARNIEAEIRYEEHLLRVRIRDDGSGLPQSRPGDAALPGRYGLQGMRERAKHIGGQLDVWSEEGAGTEIELSVPDKMAYKVKGQDTRETPQSQQGTDDHDSLHNPNSPGG